MDLVWLGTMWRDFNVALGLWAIFLVARRHHEYKRITNDQEEAFSRAVMLMLFAVVLTTAFNAYEKFPFTIGLPVITLALANVVAATVRRPDRFAGTEPAPSMFARFRRNQTHV